MYELVEEASKVLRNPTDKFNFDEPQCDPKELVEGMRDAMLKHGGLGLSANQVGVDVSVFVMRTQDEGIVGFFNPVITQISQETEMMKEGCLSFPDIYIMLKRPKTIVFDYQTEEGETRSLKLEGMGARCVQHEIDHLNGIIFLQRASQLKIERALKSRPKERAKRLQYEQRRAIAEEIQRLQSDSDTRSDNGQRSEGTDTVSQNA
jgi:peptide deformylase